MLIMIVGSCVVRTHAGSAANKAEQDDQEDLLVPKKPFIDKDFEVTPNGVLNSLLAGHGVGGVMITEEKFEQLYRIAGMVTIAFVVVFCGCLLSCWAFKSAPPPARRKKDQ